MVSITASLYLHPEVSSEMTGTIFSIKPIGLEGCEPRTVKSPVFSGSYLQGWIHFKYLCKCVSELKCSCANAVV